MSKIATDGATLSYTYDRFGNRSSMVVTGAEPYTMTYAYDANNRLLREEKPEGDVVNTTSYYYDPNGNQIASLRESTASADEAAEELSLEFSDINLYEYNAFGQQIKSVTDGVTADYTYRPDGMRHSKESAAGSVTHLWDGANIVADVDGDGVTRKYLRRIGLISSETGVMDTRYYLYNAHGDVVQLSGGSGTAVGNYDYDAFGVERNLDDADTNPFRYCGEYFDPETGTIYLRARYYNPSTGRFTQEDPIRAELNWYSYCNGNPVIYVDPTGCWAESDKYLSQRAQNAIVYWTGIYNQANKNNDFARMELAHKNAEAVRRADAASDSLTYVFYYTGTENNFDTQAFGSPYYDKSSKNVIMIGVTSANDFISGWNGMVGSVDYIYLYLHGGPGELYFLRESMGFSGNKTFDSLNNKTVNGKLFLFSCHGGKGDEGNNVAWMFAKKTGATVRANVGGVSFTKNNYARTDLTGAWHNYYYSRGVAKKTLGLPTF